MKKMNRLFLLLVSVITSLFLAASCSLPSGGRMDRMVAIESEEADKIQEMSEEIIRCLTERDQQALKDLFCESIRSLPGFDDQINRLFNYFRCDTYIDSAIDTTAGGGGLREYGEWKEWSVTPEIPYIEVILHSNPEDFDPDTGAPLGRYYSARYCWEIVNERNPSMEGLQSLRVELLNFDTCVEVGRGASLEAEGPSMLPAAEN